jgi:hypothetical protein
MVRSGAPAPRPSTDEKFFARRLQTEAFAFASAAYGQELRSRRYASVVFSAMNVMFLTLDAVRSQFAASAKSASVANSPAVDDRRLWSER